MKILDFGLAKEVPNGTDDESDRTATFLGDVSQPGTIVGSPAYMSPEQARGLAVDRRTDVWSFGCCLYESLTGSKAFRGETFSDVLAEILKSAPDFGLLPTGVPPAITLILRRCLEKQRERRFRDLTDVAIQLEDVSQFKPLEVHTPSSLESLTVLPFENLKDDPSEDYLADGIAEEISATLGKIRALTIRRIGRRIRDYREKEKSYSEIASQLNVDGMVDGSVLQIGETIKATATLLDADGTMRWTDTFSGTDFFDLQRDVAVAISNELNVNVLPQEAREMEAKKGVNMDAYRAFHDAMVLFDENVYECPEAARQLIQKAANLDADYLEPIIWLGVFHWVPTAYGGTEKTPQEGFEEARKYLARAKEIDPEASNVLMYNGWIAMAGDWDWKEAVTSFRKAIEINPSETDALKGLAVYLSYVEQRKDEALYWINKALSVEDRIHMRKFLAHIRQWSGDYEGALGVHEEILETHPSDWVHHMSTSICFRNLSDWRPALSAAERAVQLSSGNPTAKANLAVIAATSGDTAKANFLLDEIEADKRWLYAPSAAIALANAALGDTDTAIKRLQQGIDNREGFMMVQIRSHDWMSLLGAEDRYWDIIDQMKFPALSVESEFYDQEQRARFRKT